jgi:hypothetical protein
VFDDLRMFARYVAGLRSFLRRPLSPEECRRRIQQQLWNREDSFLRILEKGIFENARSPYQKLLGHAGIAFPDVARSVRREGLERTLEELHAAGVYVTLDELKGRRPILRPGLRIPVRPHEFDNPVLARHYEARTGGSRGVGSRLVIDFDLLTHEAAHYAVYLSAFDVADRPSATWRAIPPNASGMKLVLRYAKLGKAMERWFTQNRFTLRPRDLKPFLFTSYAVYGSRLWGRPLPVPEHVPLTKAERVARWLAAKRQRGTPALLDTSASSGVRVCLAAKQHGLDIAGTFFRFGGEPYTPAKARLVAESGSRAACHYSMGEIGHIGLACAAPAGLDDVHLLEDKVAVIQRHRPVGADGRSVGALYHTTVLPSCPMLMLNVESGDYGVLEERRCGCPVGELGFHRHLHGIRSYEKLTSEGIAFLGTELLRLLEEVLPASVGGNATDYQLVEEEEQGLPKVSLLVSPRVGEVDEQAVVATALRVLAAYPGGELMAEHWRQGGTLRVLRREPYVTGGAKILPLHIRQAR